MKNTTSAANCKDVLAPYFDGDNHLVQFTGVLKDGTVVYTRQYLYSYYKLLTNGDPFRIIRNDVTSCSQNNFIQPFAVEPNKQQISFLDARGIVLDSNGHLSLTPLWKLPNDTTYSFDLVCPDHSKILYGFSQDNYFSLSFVNSGRLNDKCE